MCDNEYYTPKRELSDSEESVDSNFGTNHVPSSGSNIAGELSLVAEFDDLMRCVRQARSDEVEDTFLDFVNQTKDICSSWRMAAQECRRLQTELDKKGHECSDLESKLIIARKLLDQEKRNRRHAEDERENIEAQIIKVREVLFKDTKSRIPDETRAKLQFLNTHRKSADVNNGSPDLSIIKEVNTTGSLLSNFSYSCSEDDLDVTAFMSGKTWKTHRPSTGHATEPAPKKRRSSNNKVVEISNSEKVRATTTLTVLKNGPITATSVIESLPVDVVDDVNTPTNHQNTLRPTAPVSDLIYDIWQASPTITGTNATLKQHSLHTKTVVMPDTCTPCEKRIRFGKTALKCRNCRAVCHPECKDQLPLPCIPSVTPTQRNAAGFIGDYTPTTPPMVPAIIVHCLKEIESRGLSELGIYRVPGSERDVKCLKDRFLRGKGAPCLNQVDVHVICGTVKDFLRSLSEPLVTHKLWGDFVRAVEVTDEQDIAPALYQLISKLPQPNQDTLAYMVLHLKRVADASECKMPIGNLAKVFGPTIVGYSSSDPDPAVLIPETRQQVKVMELLINLPVDYWSTFINVDQKTPKLQQTPSTDSLLRRPISRGFFSPHSGRDMAKRKPRKYFPTPPSFYN